VQPASTSEHTASRHRTVVVSALTKTSKFHRRE
jgi:hypothetical protein